VASLLTLKCPMPNGYELHPTLREIVQATARYFGVQEAAIYQHGKGQGNPPLLWL
jgi:hypothetical protein